MALCRSKIIVRNLPVTMTEEDFMALLAPWRVNIDYVHFRPGVPTKLFSPKAPRYALAYVNFTRADALLDFTAAIPKGALGEEGIMPLVEFAPFQLVPSQLSPPKRDPLEGTITEDQEYRRFLEQRERPSERPSVSLEQQIESLLAAERELHPWKYGKSKPRSTALLEYLRSSKNAVTTAAKEAASAINSGAASETGKGRKKRGKRSKNHKANTKPDVQARELKSEKTDSKQTSKKSLEQQKATTPKVVLKILTKPREPTTGIIASGGNAEDTPKDGQEDDNAAIPTKSKQGEQGTKGNGSNSGILKPTAEVPLSKNSSPNIQGPTRNHRLLATRPASLNQAPPSSSKSTAKTQLGSLPPSSPLISPSSPSLSLPLPSAPPPPSPSSTPQKVVYKTTQRKPTKN